MDKELAAGIVLAIIFGVACICTNIWWFTHWRYRLRKTVVIIDNPGTENDKVVVITESVNVAADAPATASFANDDSYHAFIDAEM